MTKPDIKPRFEVRELTKDEVGALVRTVAVIQEDGGFKYEDKPEKRRCYMVFFPSGHSIRIRGEEELKRLGFDKDPTMIDMETGDDMPTPSNQSLEEHVSRVTKPPKEPAKNVDLGQMEK